MACGFPEAMPKRHSQFASIIIQFCQSHVVRKLFTEILVIYALYSSVYLTKSVFYYHHAMINAGSIGLNLSLFSSLPINTSDFMKLDLWGNCSTWKKM